MTIIYKQAEPEDIAPVYELCRQLIQTYEQLETIDYPRVMDWVRNKIETSIRDYTVIWVDGKKAGYYHFCPEEEGFYELDDLYLFPEFQGRGIGSEVIRSCCAAVSGSVRLYVFIRNERAVSLYKRLGFQIVRTVRGSRYLMEYHKEKTAKTG